MGELLTTVSVGGKIVSLGLAAKKLHDFFREHPNNRKMKEAGEVFDNTREIAAAEVMNRLEAQAKDRALFDAALAAMLADHQFNRLQWAFRFEAAREATDERQRMLAHAAAGLSDPNMSINEKARVERALRQLDPDDLRLLDELARLDASDFVPNPNGNASEEEQRAGHLARKRFFHAQDHKLSREALRTSGTFNDFSVGVAGGLSGRLTALGEKVLNALQTYLASVRDA